MTPRPDLHRPTCPCGWSGAACRPQDVNVRLASHQRGKKCGLREPEPPRKIAERSDPNATAYPEAAACLDYDPEMWFELDGSPASLRTRRFAIAICETCPVRQDCAEACMTAERGLPISKRHGIYGGLMPGQRMRLERAMSA